MILLVQVDSKAELFFQRVSGFQLVEGVPELRVRVARHLRVRVLIQVKGFFELFYCPNLSLSSLFCPKQLN